MIEQLFLTDAYCQNFEATVTEQVEGGIVVDRTAFYPGGGGQPCDFGHFTTSDNLWRVTKVKKMQGKIVHFIEGDLPPVATAVTGQIDWEHRYKLMRTHTAMHILCGVVWRDYQAQVTGGNMDPLKGRMDFEFETMQQELVAEIETAVNAEITAARQTQVQILPRAEAFQIPDLIRTKINLLPEGIKEVRTVELVGLDLQADGGTHVKNTSEVGSIKVTNYKSKGKINKRIYIEIYD
ncbi:MAG: alanyl-tRNA editing protein [Chloroflexota bacterium]